jgi:hypothetical protein
MRYVGMSARDDLALQVLGGQSGGRTHTVACDEDLIAGARDRPDPRVRARMALPLIEMKLVPGQQASV